MVEAGHAWWFTRYAPYERHLAAAEELARRQRIGLWAAAEPVPPWTWRQRHR
jgi:micrococcal nuclease